MLPLPNLDDQVFEDIVLKARRNIARYSPEWTDENEHDPGITFIQLLAFFKEMQQYHINQISDAHRLAYLSMLGEEPREVRPARANVFVDGVSRTLTLPRGTRLSSPAAGFHTEFDEVLVKGDVARMRSVSCGKENVSVKQEVSFAVFGDKPEPGAVFELGFQAPLPAGCELRIHFAVRGAARNPVDADFIPLADVRWSALTARGWQPIRILGDGTHAFLMSGLLSFELGEAHARCAGGAMDGLYTLRCELVAASYDVTPRITNARFNILRAVQAEALCECVLFTLNGNGSALAGRMAVSSPPAIMIEAGGGWVDATDAEGVPLYRLERNASGLRIVGDGQKKNALAVFCEMGNGGLIGVGNGMPRQEMKLGATGVMPSNLRLMIAENGIVYREMKRVRSLDEADGDARVFELDEVNGIVRFGDGVSGKPPVGPVRVISLHTTAGEAGNVKAGEINGFVWPAGADEEMLALSARSFEHARGGRQAETIQKAERRVRLETQDITRAVTCADYEAIAARTPGLILKRVKAFAGGPPGNHDPNGVTVVAEPHSEGARTGLSAPQKANIERFLDKHRLITTRVHVISPVYVTVDVQLEASVRARFSSVREDLARIINDFFARNGEFGRTVNYGELYGLIDTNGAVTGITSLTLVAQGRGAGRNAAGDVLLAPHALAVLRDVWLSLSAR